MKDPVEAAPPAPQSPPSGYRTQSEDTSYEAEQILLETYRRMTPVQKVERFARIQEMVEHMALIGARLRHPEATERELRLRIAALRLDRETMIRVFDWDPAERGY